LAFVGFLLSPAVAGMDAGKRVALVMGNGAYQNAPRLDNAVLDASAVADAFRKLGFEVVEGYDLDIAGMRSKVAEFSGDLPGAKSAVIYYAGHGISVDEENYLIPTDIVLRSPTDLDFGAISVSLILRQLKREDRVNVVILDACRDNPFADALAGSRTRSVVGDRGLSRIDGDLARGTLIAFASDPKSTALDGAPGSHSPFTAAFLAHVQDPGVSIDAVMSRVRAEVWERTNHSQLPWVNTSLIGDYILNPQSAAEPAQKEDSGGAKGQASPTGLSERQSREDLLWESAQHSNLRADYQAYLDAFPNGFFAQMAKNRIAALETSGIARSEDMPQSGKEPEKRDWRAEIGTSETEKALALTPSEEKEVQQRLAALDFYKGRTTGSLDPPTRRAIAEWQASRDVASSSYLGPMQLAELRQESEDAYQKLLAAQSAQNPKAESVKAAARAVGPKGAAVVPERSAQEPIMFPRRVAKRQSPLRAAVREPNSAAPLRCNANPIWCRQAGLPVDNGAPRLGRPPGF
jgi:uncharacterized caspase-like protein